MFYHSQTENITTDAGLEPAFQPASVLSHPHLQGIKPYSAGPLGIFPPVVLAPMADVTNGSFRRVVKSFGGVGLVVTELISTAALHHGSKRTLQMFDITPDQEPVAVQIFGSDPAIMAEAAVVAEGEGAAIIDINMGCWVPKVCKTGAGAAMMRDEDAACRIVQAIVDAVKVPVTVKMRAGWSYGHLATAGLAKKLEQIGVSAFALHARFAKQGHSGNADWKLIAEMKAALRSPVIGNGDVKSPEDALRMLVETGCDGVMVGRAAIGNPWLMRDISTFLLTGIVPAPPTPQERVDTALIHMEDLASKIGESPAVRHLRGQLPHYVKGIRGASEVRDTMRRADTILEIRAVFDDLLRGRNGSHREDELLETVSG